MEYLPHNTYLTWLFIMSMYLSLRTPVFLDIWVADCTKMVDYMTILTFNNYNETEVEKQKIEALWLLQVFRGSIF